jgi:hypothetical protein
VVGAGGIGLYLSEQIRVLEWRQVSFLIQLILLSVAAISFPASSAGPSPDAVWHRLTSEVEHRRSRTGANMLADVSTGDEAAARRRAMGLLARALLSELSGPLELRFADHRAKDLKPAETGLVMLRGRADGDGAPSTWAKRR